LPFISVIDARIANNYINRCNEDLKKAVNNYERNNNNRDYSSMLPEYADKIDIELLKRNN
jgi:hypothetical protein